MGFIEQQQNQVYLPWSTFRCYFKHFWGPLSLLYRRLQGIHLAWLLATFFLNEPTILPRLRTNGRLKKAVENKTKQKGSDPVNSSENWPSLVLYPRLFPRPPSLSTWYQGVAEFKDIFLILNLLNKFALKWLYCFVCYNYFPLLVILSR